LARALLVGTLQTLTAQLTDANVKNRSSSIE
jgi:hypothetical protein